MPSGRLGAHGWQGRPTDGEKTAIPYTEARVGHFGRLRRSQAPVGVPARGADACLLRRAQRASAGPSVPAPPEDGVPTQSSRGSSFVVRHETRWSAVGGRLTALRFTCVPDYRRSSRDGSGSGNRMWSWRFGRLTRSSIRNDSVSVLGMRNLLTVQLTSGGSVPR